MISFNNLPFQKKNTIFDNFNKKHNNNRIRKSANKIITEIVEDDKYHIINEKYFDAFNKKGEKKIKYIEDDYKKKICKFNNYLLKFDNFNNRLNIFEYILVSSGIILLPAFYYIFSKIKRI